MAAKRDQVRDLLLWGTVSEPNPERARVVAMQRAVEAAWEAFYGRRMRRRHPAHLEPGHRFYALYSRAGRIAEKLCASYPDFVRAQFWGLAVSTNRPPRLWEIAGKGAADRWERYQALVACGAVLPDSDVRRKDTTATVTNRQRHEASEVMLVQLMRNYDASEEQVLRVFATEANSAMFFDLGWLNANPTYRKLKAAGEL